MPHVEKLTAGSRDRKPLAKQAETPEKGLEGPGDQAVGRGRLPGATAEERHLGSLFLEPRWAVGGSSLGQARGWDQDRTSTRKMTRSPDIRFSP